MSLWAFLRSWWLRVSCDSWPKYGQPTIFLNTSLQLNIYWEKRKTTSEFKIKTVQLNTIYNYPSWAVYGACLMLCCQSASVHVQCVYGSLEVTYEGWWSPVLHLRWYKLQKRCRNCYRNTGDVRVCLKKFLGFIPRELVCSHFCYPWDVRDCHSDTKISREKPQTSQQMHGHWFFGRSFFNRFHYALIVTLEFHSIAWKCWPPHSTA